MQNQMMNNVNEPIENKKSTNVSVSKSSSKKQNDPKNYLKK